MRRHPAVAQARRRKFTAAPVAHDIAGSILVDVDQVAADGIHIHKRRGSGGDPAGQEEAMTCTAELTLNCAVAVALERTPTRLCAAP